MNKRILSAILVLSAASSLSYANTPTLITSENSTQQIVRLGEISEKNLTQQEVNNLIANAKIRAEYMQANLDNSATFVKLLLPNKITQTLPKQAQPYLEKEVSNIEGTLEILAAVYADGKKDTTQYWLHQNNKSYRLHFSDTPPANLQTDMKIKVTHGFRIPTNSAAEDLVVSADDITILKNVAALPLSFGPQNVLAILVNFSNAPTNRPWTTDTIKSVVYTDVNNYYKEVSYNQSSITGQLAGWYVINVASTSTCDTIVANVPTLANQAATKAGIDISKYPRKLYIFPKTSSCTWTGLGTVGGQNTKVWVNGSPVLTKTITHEIGHNVGLHHAQALRCTTSPISGNCTVSEYGDGSDTMGNIAAGHFNAFSKDRLGWLNYQASPPITTVTKSGSYYIDPYETVTSRPKALKILKRAGGTDYYYLEFRQPIGFDNVLDDCGTSCNYTRGVTFHQGNLSGSNPSQLLDMSPGTGNQNVALLPCQSWSDAGAPNGGITFLVQSISSQGARVKITYGGLTDQCHRESPTVKMTPSYTKWMANGQSETYTLSVKNNDSKNCPARSFTLAPVANNSFLTTTVPNTDLNVAAGSTEKLTITPKSTYTGAPLIYSMELQLKDKLDSKSIVMPFNIGLSKA